MPMVCGYCGSQIEIDGEVLHQIGCLAPVQYGSGDEDAPDAYDPDETTDVCADCGKSIADEDVCGVCGRAMCFGCFEMGAGVCKGPHREGK